MEILAPFLGIIWIIIKVFFYIFISFIGIVISLIFFILLIVAPLDRYIFTPLKRRKEKKHFEKMKKQGLLKTKEDYKKEVETWEKFKEEVKKMVEDFDKKYLPKEEVQLPYYKNLRILSFRTIDLFFPIFEDSKIFFEKFLISQTDKEFSDFVQKEIDEERVSYGILEYFDYTFTKTDPFLKYKKNNSQKEIKSLGSTDLTIENISYEPATEIVNFFEKHLYLLAKFEGQFAGFIEVDNKSKDKKIFFIREIFVDPEFQQIGLESELMKKVIDYTKDNAGKYVFTQTAFENIPLQKLCEHFGFEKWENEEWKDGITYRRKI
jgi:ribosomal protein S18 acetylase RimI-like enzyme